jgi:hypothetical protein
VNQARAFSDTEILTIATVAASALGGIVIGLGRGQDNGPPAAAHGQGMQAALRHAAHVTAERVPSMPAARMPVELTQLRKKYEDIRPTKRKLARRAAMKFVVRPALEGARSRIPARSAVRETSIAEALAGVGASISNVRPDRDTALDLKELSAQLISGLTSLATSARQTAGREVGARDGVLGRLAGELENIEAGLPEASEKVRELPERSRRIVRQRVAEPLSEAATTTGNATKESLAALAWLGLGASIVYFGMLSDDRREQVKASLCGVVEQARLLMLDLQGYDPEM